MKAQEYLAWLVNEAHTTIAATTDSEGLPVTCAIDMMDSDEGGLYFLTAKGKQFYGRLIRRGNIALTGLKGENTLSCTALSVRGRARDVGPGRLTTIFEKNPYMNEIYPSEESRAALTVFQIYEGTGEWFDLSRRPVERSSFAFGGARQARWGYWIDGHCTNCGRCASVCPQDCIDLSKTPATIQQAHCLHCGNCLEICPQGAVVRMGREEIDR